MGCTSGKQIKKKTSSVEDVSLQKGSAAQTNASPNKNGQAGGKQSGAIQIPGANKSFLAPDGIPFIDEDVDDQGEQLYTTKVNDNKTDLDSSHVGNATVVVSPGKVTTTTTAVTTKSSGGSALQGGGDSMLTTTKTTTHHIDISGERPAVIDQILQKEARTTQHQEPQNTGRSSPEIANAENTSRQQVVAATKIQAGIRGYLDRKKVRAMRAQQQQNHSGGNPDNNKHHSDGGGSGDDGRHVLNDKVSIEARYADAATDPQLNSAATKIQANYKGYKTRKQMKFRK